MMQTDYEHAYHIFEENLMSSAAIKRVEIKKVAGLPFVYVWPGEKVDRKVIEDVLKLSAATAMRGKRLTLAMSFVRKDQAYYVYRVRFLVPQRKMFCCGNLCDDCIRFTT